MRLRGVECAEQSGRSTLGGTDGAVTLPALAGVPGRGTPVARVVELEPCAAREATKLSQSELADFVGVPVK